MDFEEQIREVRGALERFVHFRVASRDDADDLLQEIFLSAYRSYPTLSDPQKFKPWILSIARNRCHDYYRKQSRTAGHISLDAMDPERLSVGTSTPVRITAVELALDTVSEKDRKLLMQFYFRNLSLAEIARRENIPQGTVKSRLHYAREHFREAYLHLDPMKGEKKMKQLPKRLPEYTIEENTATPFPVVWEELLGWMIVPRLGEKLTWGIYDMPQRTLSDLTRIECVGEAEVHGIRGVELQAVQYSDLGDTHDTGLLHGEERRFIAQLTDTHCRYLAESHMQDGIRRCYTFLDGDAFLANWGYGEDNCGSDIHPVSRGLIQKEGEAYVCDREKAVMDVVGRFTVTIGGKVYDTIRLMDVESYNEGVATEQYIDTNGRTVLWRRFNRDNWEYDRYSRNWTEILPENERMTVNGETYVHWYDCISDYIL